VTDEKPKKATAGDVRAALRGRYPHPAWAVFDEVGNGTGSRCDRHADMIAMSIWPSRGLVIHGIEIKVSRSDWLKELADPKKADSIQRWCDHWWIAVGDEKIVQGSELPPNWGLLVLRGNRLVAKVEAPKLEPIPLDRAFVAAMLRRASESLESARQEGDRAGYARGVATGPKDIDTEAVRELRSLKQKVDAFEAASGLKIGDEWRAGQIGDAVKRLQLAAGRYYRAADPREAIEQAAQYLEGSAQRLRENVGVEVAVAAIVNELPPEQIEALRGVA
jgi:hypothetical protein